MNYTFLGKTGVQVSQLCFGTMSFGGDADATTSAALFARCREAGINFFDCADVYSRGEAETILGRLLQGSRDEIVLTSKVHGAMSDDRNERGLSRRHITRAVEASLKRLGTDRLDLYFVHQIDPDTPVEETLRALDDLVRAGKICLPRCQQLGSVANRACSGQVRTPWVGTICLRAADVLAGQATG
jgi:aryl-alcohol dehydrogenase-like predicted oxidoreductase